MEGEAVSLLLSLHERNEDVILFVVAAAVVVDFVVVVDIANVIVIVLVDVVIVMAVISISICNFTYSFFYDLVAIITQIIRKLQNQRQQRRQ